jgi:hypothetical protein
MATEFEFDVKGMDQLRRDLDEVKRLLGGVGTAHQGLSAQQAAAGQTTASFGASVASIGVPIAAATAALAAGFAAAKKFGGELERQAGVLKAFGGSIEEASTRTNGLYTRLQLIEAWNKSAQAGLRLSQKSFANLAVAADEFAGATGQDSVQALETLTHALSTGAVRAFKQLGIEVDTTKTKAQQQQQIIDELGRRYGDLSATVDTVGGMFDVLGNRLDDAQTDFMEGISSVDMMRGGFGELTGAVNDFAAALGIASGDNGTGLSIFTQAGITAGVMIDGLSRRLAALLRAIEQASTGDFANAARELGTTTASFDTEISAGTRAMIRSGAQQSARAGAASVAPTQFAGGGGGGGRGGGGRRRPFTLIQGGAQSLNAGEAVEMKGLSQLGAGDFDREGDIALLDEKLAAENAIGEAIAKQNAEMQAQQEILAGIASNVSALSMSIFEQGPKKGFQNWAKSFAKQQLALGIEATALGVGSLFVNPAAATGYFERAALHGVAAAAAGGAGAAIGGGRDRGRGGGGGARPEQPSSAANDGGSRVPNVVHVHINSPVQESELGRMNARARQEAERRFGT